MNQGFDRVDLSNNILRRQGGNTNINFNEILQDLSGLQNILAKETELLKKFKYREAKELFEEKNRLVRRLEIFREIAIKSPNLIEGKTEAGVAAFNHIGQKIGEVIRNNFDEVLKVREVNKKIVEAVIKAVEKHKGISSAYNKQGITYKNSIGISSGYSGESYSLAVNQVI